MFQILLESVLEEFDQYLATLLTYLLTELGPSWEAANCAATQELPRILRNPKVHHRVHKSPPLAPILSEIVPVHTIPSCLSKIYFSIVSGELHFSNFQQQFKAQKKAIRLLRAHLYLFLSAYDH
jgi:hypothetical protein